MGKRSWNFLTCTCSQLTVRSGETSSLRCRFAPTSTPHYWKGGNEERDRRLQVVNLITALSYCVGSSFCFRIAFTVKRCVSAQKPWIVAGWVWVGRYGLLVGEWVVTRWVVLPLFLRSPSPLIGARQRTNLVWRANTNGPNKCVQPHPPPTFISLLSHGRQRKIHGLRCIGVCAGVGEGVII